MLVSWNVPFKILLKSTKLPLLPVAPGLLRMPLSGFVRLGLETFGASFGDG